MNLNKIRLDDILSTPENMEYYIYLKRAVRIFNMFTNKITNRQYRLFDSDNSTTSIVESTRLYHLFNPDEPDYELYSAEILTTKSIRYLCLNLNESSFVVANFFRPNVRKTDYISVKDYQFIIASKTIPFCRHPYCSNPMDRPMILGEIYDFIADYD